MGGFWGKKNLEKCSPLSHNVQKQLDWDFMECANLSRDSVVRCEQKKQLPMQQNSQNIGWSENLAFYWRFGFFVGRSVQAGSFGQKMPACSKKRPWHPPIFGGGRGKSGGFSPLTSRLLKCGGRRLDGKRSDSWEKTVKSSGWRHFFTDWLKHRRCISGLRWINHPNLAAV